VPSEVFAGLDPEVGADVEGAGVVLSSAEGEDALVASPEGVAEREASPTPAL
jgi:hypothetical protein